MKASYVVANVGRTSDPTRVAVSLSPQADDKVVENPERPGAVYLIPGEFIMQWDSATQPKVNDVVEISCKVRAAQEGA